MANISEGVRELVERVQELANNFPHEQSEDPADGMVATETCAHCQLLLTVIPAIQALATLEAPAAPRLSEEQVRLAINRSLQPALAREVVSIEKLTQLLNTDLAAAAPAEAEKRGPMEPVINGMTKAEWFAALERAEKGAAPAPESHEGESK